MKREWEDEIEEEASRLIEEGVPPQQALDIARESIGDSQRFVEAKVRKAMRDDFRSRR